MNRYLLITIFTALSAVLAASCAQKSVEPGLPEASTEEIVERVELLHNSVRSVKGLASVSIKTRDESISYTQVTLAEEPNLLRLEALNPFGSTVGFVSSDGERVYIVSQNGRDEFSLEEAFNLAYVYPGLNLRITVDDLVDLVSGRVPKDIFTQSTDAEVSSSPEGVLVRFNNGAGTQDDKLWINPQNSRVERAQIMLDNGDTGYLKYEYFDGLVGGYYFPRVIDFKTGELSIKITYEPDVDLNTGVDRTLLKP